MDREQLRLRKLEELQRLQGQLNAAKIAKNADWKNDPAGWVDQRLGEHFWSKQREIAESVRDNRRTAVQACHGVGKSFAMSRIVTWWLDVHPVGEAFVVTTAPTFPQVRAILWREIHRAAAKGHIIGDLSETEWKINGELVAFGRKPSDYDPGAFQGIHARYVLVVIDEGCAVPTSIYDAADTLITGTDCRIVVIGNPDDPATEFAKVCAPGSGWNNISISAFESPNFTGEWVPEDVRGLLTSPEWVEEKRKKWRPGQHPFWDSKIMGRFPEAAADSLISMGDIRRAQLRWEDGAFLDDEEPNLVACDVARFGDDETVIGQRRGRRFWVREAYGKSTTMEAAGYLIRAMRDTHATHAIVDDDGVGGGVVDRLRELEEPVQPFNGGKRARDPREHLNVRAQNYWHLRDLFQTDQVAIDPADDELATQLGGLKWKISSTGAIQIESKADAKKRGLDSPDRADTMSMIMYDSVINFDDIWDTWACVKCGHMFVLKAADVRTCPKCGTRNSRLDVESLTE